MAEDITAVKEQSDLVEFIEPIEVTLRLKREQRERDGFFYITYKGERLKVLNYIVKFHATTLIEAIQSFEVEECISYKIESGPKQLT